MILQSFASLYCRNIENNKALLKITRFSDSYFKNNDPDIENNDRYFKNT